MENGSDEQMNGHNCEGTSRTGHVTNSTYVHVSVSFNMKAEAYQSI